MKVLVVEYLISLRHAIKLMRALNLVKKHAVWGYYFNLQETSFKVTRTTGLIPDQEDMLFSENYKLGTPLYHLKVFRDKENKRPCEAATPNDNPPLTSEAKLVLERLLSGVTLQKLIDHVNSTIQGRSMKTDEEYELLVKQVVYRVKQALATFKDEPDNIRQKLNKLVIQEIVTSLNGSNQITCIEGAGLIKEIQEPGSAGPINTQ